MEYSKNTNKGAWTAEEDRQLAEVISIHGAKRWKSIATKAGLNRCGKSCRLRWMNYLRPNIKRGNISDQEEDLILRLHKLLGNRWSLIAGRLPGRTDNEIKNYWNSHLSKKTKHRENKVGVLLSTTPNNQKVDMELVNIDNVPETTNDNNNNNQTSQSSNSTSTSDEDCYDTNNVNNTKNNNNKSNSKMMMGFNVDEFFDFTNEDPMNLEWMSRFLEQDNYDDD